MPLVQAKRASDFVSSIGVNTHVAYYNTAYANTQGVVADLLYLGVNHVRDSAPVWSGGQAWFVSYEIPMAAGIKFDLVIPSDALNVQVDLADINALEASDPGGIDAIEGINEAGASITYYGLSGEAAANAFQAQLFAAVDQDSQLQGVQVYNYTAGTDPYTPSTYTQFGNISANANDGNAHVYPGYQAPTSAFWFMTEQLAGTPNDPFVVTETGYDTMPGMDTDGSQGVNDDVQAKYTLDDIFDLVKAGASMVYIYELLDESPDPNMTNHEDHFGLFNSDGTPKEAAVSLHDLTTILADDGGTASSFSPGTLAYSISNLPSTGNSMLLEKSDGSFYLAVWAEPAIWNPTTLQEIAVAPTPVMVNLGQVVGSVEVYDPLIGTTPIASYSDVNEVTLEITDHPLIIEIDPVTAPLLSGMLATQTATTTMAPFSTLLIGDAAAKETAVVTPSAGTNGTFGNLGSGTWSPLTGTYTVTGTPQQVAAALQGLTFTPAGDTTTTLSVTVTNASGSAGSSTTVVDPARLSMPSVSGIPATQSAAASVAPFAELDLTDAASMDGASVMLYTTSQGTLTNLGIGTYSIATGVYSVYGAPAQVEAALQGLLFIPEAGSAMAYTTTFWLTVSNQAGTSGFTTSVTGANALPPPSVSEMPAALIGVGTIMPFSALQITNLAASEGATVMLSTPAQGTFGNLGNGSYTASSGLYGVTGTPAQVAADLQNLTFTPAASAALVATATLTLGVANLVGFYTADTTVAEVNQSLLPIPTGETAAATLWTPGTGASMPVSGAFNEAVVLAAAGSIAAPTGFQAVLLGGSTAAQLSDDSVGDMVLTANQGTDTLEASMAGDTLIGSTGSDSYIVDGNDKVLAGTGTTSIVAAGANRLTLGSGAATVTSGGGDTIEGGAGSAVISAGTGDTVYEGTGTFIFIGGTGSTTVIGSAGTVLITGAANVVAAGSVISAAAGSVQQIVVGGGGSHIAMLGSGRSTLDASASTGSTVLTAGSGADQILGGTGSTIMVAGTGNATLTAAGPTQFEFVNGNAGGTDIIAGFNPAHDSIVLSGYAASAIAAAVQSAVILSGSTMIGLSDGTHITLEGVTGATKSWFATALR